MVPDCGYKLRRIEVEAIGQLDQRRFIFDSNRQVVNLEAPATKRGHGKLIGHFEAPITPRPTLTIISFEAGDPR
jgi:hypothetical protein